MKYSIKKLEEWEGVAKSFLEHYPQGGCFGLEGDLGVGKTTFVRAIIQELAQANGKPMPRVISPSYVVHQHYEFEKAAVDHFDFYRLENLTQQGLTEIGFWEAYERYESGSRTGYVFIEWPQKAAAKSLPLIALKFGACDLGVVRWIEVGF